MVGKVANKIKLQSVNELLGVPEIAGTMDVDVNRIHGFLNHPFKVVDDDKMEELVASITANGVLSPVIIRPDKQGNYEYALKSNTCCETGCTTYIRDWMFTIIKENLFNRKQANIVNCQNNTRIWHGEYSYIPMVRWDYFKSHVTSLIERAERIKDDYEKNDSYNLHLSVNK